MELFIYIIIAIGSFIFVAIPMYIVQIIIGILLLLVAKIYKKYKK